jgi:hypothetical protein
MVVGDMTGPKEAGLQRVRRVPLRQRRDEGRMVQPGKVVPYQNLSLPLPSQISPQVLLTTSSRHY